TLAVRRGWWPFGVASRTVEVVSPSCWRKIAFALTAVNERNRLVSPVPQRKKPLVKKRVLQVRFGNALDPVVLIVPRITCGECDINLDNRALLVHVLLRAYLKSTVLFKNSERSEEHTSELQSRGHLVCRLLLE